MEIYHCTIILDLDVANKFAFCYILKFDRMPFDNIYSYCMQILRDFFYFCLNHTTYWQHRLKYISHIVVLLITTRCVSRILVVEPSTIMDFAT